VHNIHILYSFTTSYHVLLGLPLSLAPSTPKVTHFFTQSLRSFLKTPLQSISLYHRLSYAMLTTVILRAHWFTTLSMKSYHVLAAMQHCFRCTGFQIFWQTDQLLLSEQSTKPLYVLLYSQVLVDWNMVWWPSKRQACALIDSTKMTQYFIGNTYTRLTSVVTHTTITVL